MTNIYNEKNNRLLGEMYGRPEYYIHLNAGKSSESTVEIDRTALDDGIWGRGDDVELIDAMKDRHTVKIEGIWLVLELRVFRKMADGRYSEVLLPATGEDDVTVALNLDSGETKTVNLRDWFKVAVKDGELVFLETEYAKQQDEYIVIPEAITDFATVDFTYEGKKYENRGEINAESVSVFAEALALEEDAENVAGVPLVFSMVEIPM